MFEAVDSIGKESRFTQILVFRTCQTFNATLPKVMANKLLRQAPISIGKIDPTYTILLNQTNTVTLNFADPLVLAKPQDLTTTDEEPQFSGLQIKVLSITHPSVVSVDKLAYDSLGFG